MRKPYFVLAVSLMLLAAFLVYESVQLNYSTPLGPGPGFFPFWLGCSLFGLAIIQFMQAARDDSCNLPIGWIPEAAAIRRICGIVGVLLGVIFILPWLGYRLTMFVFFMILLLPIGHQPLLLSLTVAVGGSVGVYALFTELLDIPLPTGFLGI